MVLAVRLAASAALALAACSADPAPPSPKPQTQPRRTEAAIPATARPASASDQAVVAGRTLRLSAPDGRCVLADGARTLSLDLAGPCRFTRYEANGPAATQAYAGKGTTAIVAGGPAPAAAYPPNAGKGPADRCSDKGRMVAVRDGAVALGPVRTEPVGFCPDLAPDEKYYRQLAADLR